MRIFKPYVIKQVFKTITSICFIYFTIEYLLNLNPSNEPWVFIIALLLISPFILFHIISIFFVIVPPNSKYNIINYDIHYHKLDYNPYAEFVVAIILGLFIGLTLFQIFDSIKWTFFSYITILFVLDIWIQLEKLNEFPSSLLHQKKLIVRTAIPKLSKSNSRRMEENLILGRSFEVMVSESNLIKIQFSLDNCSINVYEIKSESLRSYIKNRAWQFWFIKPEDFAADNLELSQVLCEYELVATLINIVPSQFIELELELRKNEDWNKFEQLRKKYDSIRSMTVEKAEMIVKEYGKILANPVKSELAHPISVLPYSKEEIRHAIKLYIKVVPEESKTTVRNLYPFLNLFVDDEIAIQINNIELRTNNEEVDKLYLQFASQLADGIHNIPDELWT